MPAVTADTIKLPHITRIRPDSVPRGVLGTVDAPTRLEGEGFQVRRPFPGIDLSIADPFLLLDHLGAVEYAPGEAKGAPDHPHRGFETVTYIIDGAIEHRDSIGGGGTITDGATQWMTAGAGIVHSEMPPEYLVASWRPVPRRPAVGQPAGLAQVVTAALPGHRAPARSPCSPRPTAAPWSAHRRRARRATPAPDRPTRRSPMPTPPSSPVPGSTSPGDPTSTPWSMSWSATATSVSRRSPIREGQLAVFGAGDHLVVEGDRRLEGPRRTLEVLILGGLPIREPIVSLRTVRDEHPRGDHRGHPGLPGRPDGPDPAAHALTERT